MLHTHKHVFTLHAHAVHPPSLPPSLHTHGTYTYMLIQLLLYIRIIYAYVHVCTIAVVLTAHTAHVHPSVERYIYVIHVRSQTPDARFDRVHHTRAHTHAHGETKVYIVC